jgi:predicted nucleic acid-binding Zn ribbon protein
MKSLRSLLEKRENKLKISLNEKDIFFIFQKIIQEEYGSVGANKFRADFFKNGILFIKSESSVWASELWMNRSRLMKKMIKELGDDAIKQIKVK